LTERTIRDKDVGAMTLFYEVIGTLLSRIGEALPAGDGPAASQGGTDRRTRQMALTLRRIGAIWPDLPDALRREIEILTDAVAEVEATITNAGVAPEAVFPERTADPLAHHRQLLQRLERAIVLLHQHHQESWAADALHRARRAMADAAAVHGELVDRALAETRRVPAS
jgi:hypothetical protein